MKNRVLGCLVLGLATLAAAVGQGAPSRQLRDVEAIRAVLTDYVEGWRDGDVQRLRGAFDPAGVVLWLDGDQHLSTMTFGEILERGSRPQPSYGSTWRVLSLDVVDEDLAIAKLEIARKGGAYIDVLGLQRVAAGWRIVTKRFVVR